MAISGYVGEALTEELQASDSEIMQCADRMMSAGLPELVQDWAGAELARGTHPVHICFALIQLAGSVTATLMVDFLDEADHAEAGTHFVRLLKYNIKTGVAEQMALKPKGKA